MNKTAFRIIPGRQPGLFRPQLGKRVFWFFWQWYDIKHPPSGALVESVVSVWNLAINPEKIDQGRAWKNSIDGDIKP